MPHAFPVGSWEVARCYCQSGRLLLRGGYAPEGQRPRPNAPQGRQCEGCLLWAMFILMERSTIFGVVEWSGGWREVVQPASWPEEVVG